MKKRLPFSIRFLYFVFLWCVFSFKVFLGSVAEAGLRIDDILLAIVFAVLLFRGDFAKVPRSKAFRVYLLFAFVSFCSAAWNGLVGRVSFIYSTIFVFRTLEYMVFYYLGYVLLQYKVQIWRGLQFYLYALCVVVPLQMLRIIPTASLFDVTRASGNTNGPYELATVSAFLLCFLGYRNKDWFRGALAIILMVLTGARSTFVGTALSMLKVLVKHGNRKTILIGACAFAGVALAGGTALFLSSSKDIDPNGNVFDRLSSATDLASVDIMALYYQTPTYKTSTEYIDGAYLNAVDFSHQIEGDASATERIFRWTALIKSALLSIDSTLIGLGPSFGSAAVDGYFVRVFVETGIVGMCVFLWFIYALLSSKGNSPWQFREYVFILVVTALSIDIFVSYKSMLFLWLWHGMNEYQARQDAKAKRLSDVSNASPALN